MTGKRPIKIYSEKQFFKYLPFISKVKNHSLLLYEVIYTISGMLRNNDDATEGIS